MCLNMQTIRLPPDEIDETDQAYTSALKDLDHEVGIYHTDHLSVRGVQKKFITLSLDAAQKITHKK